MKFDSFLSSCSLIYSPKTNIFLNKGKVQKTNIRWEKVNCQLIETWFWKRLMINAKQTNNPTMIVCMQMDWIFNKSIQQYL